MGGTLGTFRKTRPPLLHGSMNDTPAIVEKPQATRLAALQRGGGPAGAADFGAALAKAHETSKRVEDRPAAAGGSNHRVQAGETLYGIAKARLARAGQAATPGATMGYALEIAKTNQIRNPDRIYAGQTLQLSAPAATAIGSNLASPEGGRSAIGSIPAGGEAARSAAYAEVFGALHEPESGHESWAADWPDEGAESVQAAEDGIALAYGQPAVGQPTLGQPTIGQPATCQPATGQPSISAAAAGDAPSEDQAGIRPDGVDRARAGLALYQQTASAAEPKPSSEVPDLIYKGLVGKALDMVPLEPATRTGLQQANAIIGGAFAGRSLVALTGLGGPLLTVAGLLWGIFSAHKIGAGQPEAPNQLAQNTSATSID